MQVAPDQTPTTPAVVAASHVSAHLGADFVLHDISFTVSAGESVALLGGNGSGKTTLTRALLGLVPASGTIELFGTELHRFRQWQRLAYVPQHPAPGLLDVTVAEAVSAGLLSRLRPFQPLGKTHKERICEAIQLVGLTGQERRVVGQLSGGQRRRALIARALVSEPELLVMDEPFAGVDLATQHALAGVIADLDAFGVTMMTVLHETSMMDHLLDRVLTLTNGHLAAA